MKYFPRECILTLDELKAKCDEWKPVLGLENWSIRIKISRQEEIPDLSGVVYPTDPIRQAMIKISDPVDWTDEYNVYDMEQTLVHEMLHIPFHSFIDFEGIYDVLFEQNIELLACALVGLKRVNLAE